MKRYRIIKELPDIKEPWLIIEPNPVDGKTYISEDGYVSIPKSTVENNPRFFEELDEGYHTTGSRIMWMHKRLNREYYNIPDELKEGYDKCLSNLMALYNDEVSKYNK